MGELMGRFIGRTGGGELIKARFVDVMRRAGLPDAVYRRHKWFGGGEAAPPLTPRGRQPICHYQVVNPPKKERPRASFYDESVCVCVSNYSLPLQDRLAHLR